MVIVSNICLSFAVSCQRWVCLILNSFFFFFHKIFHIMYLMGANNGEQVSNSVWIPMHPIYKQQKTVGRKEMQIFLVASMFGRDCRHKPVLFCKVSLQWCLLSFLIFRGRHQKCGKLLHGFPLCQVLCGCMHESYLPRWFLQGFLQAVKEIVIFHPLCCSCTSLPAAERKARVDVSCLSKALKQALSL